MTLALPLQQTGIGQALEERLWSYPGPITAGTNAFLQPPPPHMLALRGAAAAHQPVADAFVTGFADPVPFAAALATLEGCQKLLAAAQAPAIV